MKKFMVNDNFQIMAQFLTKDFNNRSEYKIKKSRIKLNRTRNHIKIVPIKAYRHRLAA